MISTIYWWYLTIYDDIQPWWPPRCWWCWPACSPCWPTPSWPSARPPSSSSSGQSSSLQSSRSGFLAPLRCHKTIARAPNDPTGHFLPYAGAVSLWHRVGFHTRNKGSKNYNYIMASGRPTRDTFLAWKPSSSHKDKVGQELTCWVISFQRSVGSL